MVKQLYILLLILCSCSITDKVSLDQPEGRRVVLEHDAWVKGVGAEVEQKKAGDTIDVVDTPILVESPGRIGVLVLPPRKKIDEVKLELRPIGNWSGDATKEVAGQIVSEIMQDMAKVQQDLSLNRPQPALETIKRLREKYPAITYLKLAEASCLVVMGRNQEARDILKQVMVESPANVEAKDLYRNIASEGAN